MRFVKCDLVKEEAKSQPFMSKGSFGIWIIVFVVLISYIFT